MAFAATMLAVVGLYGAIVVTLAPDYGWIERALPLLLLVMATHVLVDTRGHLLDRVLYVPLVGSLRGQLRELANRVVRQPDALSALTDVRETLDQIVREHASLEAETNAGTAWPTELRVLVEGALRHLNDLPALSQHPLLVQLVMLPGTRSSVPRGCATISIRRSSACGRRVRGLRLAAARWAAAALPGPQRGVRRWSAEQTGDAALLLSEGTFHRARRSAIDAIASDLAERRPP